MYISYIVNLSEEEKIKIDQQVAENRRHIWISVLGITALIIVFIQTANPSNEEVQVLVQASQSQNNSLDSPVLIRFSDQDSRDGQIKQYINDSLISKTRSGADFDNEFDIKDYWTSNSEQKNGLKEVAFALILFGAAVSIISPLSFKSKALITEVTTSVNDNSEATIQPIESTSSNPLTHSKTEANAFSVPANPEQSLPGDHPASGYDILKKEYENKYTVISYNDFSVVLEDWQLAKKVYHAGSLDIKFEDFGFSKQDALLIRTKSLVPYVELDRPLPPQSLLDTMKVKLAERLFSEDTVYVEKGYHLEAGKLKIVKGFYNENEKFIAFCESRTGRIISFHKVRNNRITEIKKNGFFSASLKEIEELGLNKNDAKE